MVSWLAENSTLYMELTKLADNGDFVGFVDSLFGVTKSAYANAATEEKAKIEELAASLKLTRAYYHDIKKNN